MLTKANNGIQSTILTILETDNKQVTIFLKDHENGTEISFITASLTFLS